MDLTTPEHLQAHLSALPIAEPRVVAGGNFATPRTLLEVADRSFATWRLFVLNAQPPLPSREGITYETPFVGPAVRNAGERLRYLPMRLSLVPTLLARATPPDLVFVRASVPSAGRVSLGVEVNVLPAAIEIARARGALVVAELDPNVPYVFGDGELELDDIDLAIETDTPLAQPTTTTRADPQADAIAERIAALVPEGATLQLGIGAIPDRVLSHLAARRELGIWSEMVSDGILALERRGALSRTRPITASFLFGTDELYRWVDRNPRLRLLRTETVNDPSRIMRQPRMSAINAAIEVDLAAQANAHHVGQRVLSGFGGQPDFTVGALHADGGQSIIAVRAWHAPTDRSGVVAALSTPVTSFQHSVFVSEHGTAHLFGASADEQAQRIVASVADPRVRAELAEALAEARATNST